VLDFLYVRLYVISATLSGYLGEDNLLFSNIGCPTFQFMLNLRQAVSDRLWF
jgi:hypothetical protein